MKRILHFLVISVVFYLCGLIIGTFLYSCFLNIINYVDGDNMRLFNSLDFSRAFFYVMLCMFFLIGPLVAYYRVRHVHGFSQLLAYIVLFVFVWGIAFPFAVIKTLNFFEIHPTYSISKHLSHDKFRVADNRAFYFIDDFVVDEENPKAVKTVVIDLEKQGVVEVKNIVPDSEFKLFSLARPYKEIHLKNNFSNRFTSNIFSFQTLVNTGITSYMRGWTFYLGFLSIGLALFSLFALSDLFQWRLINSICIACMTVFILVINSCYYTPFFEAIKISLGKNKTILHMGNYVSEPVLFIINLTICLIMLIITLVRFIILRQKNKK